jgi:hypothetical protein
MSKEKNKSIPPLSRRNFIRLSALAGAAAPAIAASARAQVAEQERRLQVGLHELNEVTTAGSLALVGAAPSQDSTDEADAGRGVIA